MTDEYKKLLRMLGIALIEIRASDTHERAKGLADIFHNLPAQIASGMEPETILERMRATAKRKKQEEYLEWLIEHWS